MAHDLPLSGNYLYIYTQYMYIYIYIYVFSCILILCIHVYTVHIHIYYYYYKRNDVIIISNDFHRWQVETSAPAQLVGPPSEFWSYDPNFVQLGLRTEAITSLLYTYKYIWI